jgi:hypothetical protein
MAAKALMLGVTMTGKKSNATTGEYLGTAAGEVHPLALDDISHIPDGTASLCQRASTYKRTTEIPAKGS